MEPQEAFDKMVSHLRKQGEQSKVRIGKKCLYRSDTGLKCAVGCLIPDEDYCSDMENQGASSFRGFPTFKGWPAATLDVMSNMQGMHDNTLVRGWERGFSDVALVCGLELHTQDRNRDHLKTGRPRSGSGEGANEMTQKTVRVRIAVAMGTDGNWISEGSRGMSDDTAVRYLNDHIRAPGPLHFIEADIPLPTSVTVEGEVVS